MSGNIKRPRKNPASARYKTAGRSELNKQKRITKEKKKMERAKEKRGERKIRNERKMEAIRKSKIEKEEVQSKSVSKRLKIQKGGSNG